MAAKKKKSIYSKIAMRDKVSQDKRITGKGTVVAGFKKKPKVTIVSKTSKPKKKK